MDSDLISKYFQNHQIGSPLKHVTLLILPLTMLVTGIIDWDYRLTKHNDIFSSRCISTPQTNYIKMESRLVFQTTDFKHCVLLPNETRYILRELARRVGNV